MTIVKTDQRFEDETVAGRPGSKKQLREIPVVSSDDDLCSVPRQCGKLYPWVDDEY